MKNKTWMKIGGAALVVGLLVSAGVAMAHAGGMRPGATPIEYEGDAVSGSLTDVNVNGTVLFESVDFEPADARLIARGPGVALRATNATAVTLVLPEDASIVVHDEVEAWSPAGATITYADGQKANLVLKNATLEVDGATIVLELDADGAASFLLREGPPFGFGPGHGFGDHPGPRMHGHGPRR